MQKRYLGEKLRGLKKEGGFEEKFLESMRQFETRRKRELSQKKNQARLGSFFLDKNLESGCFVFRELERKDWSRARGATKQSKGVGLREGASYEREKNKN